MKYEVTKHSDGQVTAKTTRSGDLHVEIRVNSYEDLFKAASIKEAWDSAYSLNKGKSSILDIKCLIGQRSDRRFNADESFDLKVICGFINSMGFDWVKILHPHSSVSLALINNCKPVDYFGYVRQAYNDIGNPVLISPDAGAYKSTYDIAEELKANLVASNKVRKGGIPLVSIQGDVIDKDCLIVDDIADGGRTFKYLAHDLKEQGADKVFLYVTHGMFNFGFDELKESIDHVYCTNSYRHIQDDFVTQYQVI